MVVQFRTHIVMGDFIKLLRHNQSTWRDDEPLKKQHKQGDNLRKKKIKILLSKKEKHTHKNISLQGASGAETRFSFWNTLITAAVQM